MVDGSEMPEAGQASPGQCPGWPTARMVPMGLLLPKPAIVTGEPATPTLDSRGPLGPRPTVD
jgi:hypothetical protein